MCFHMLCHACHVDGESRLVGELTTPRECLLTVQGTVAVAGCRDPHIFHGHILTYKAARRPCCLTIYSKASCAWYKVGSLLHEKQANNAPRI
jgi:hypothetical protein